MLPIAKRQGHALLRGACCVRPTRGGSRAAGLRTVLTALVYLWWKKSSVLRCQVPELREKVPECECEWGSPTGSRSTAWGGQQWLSGVWPGGWSFD